MSYSGTTEIIPEVILRNPDQFANLTKFKTVYFNDGTITHGFYDNPEHRNFFFEAADGSL